MNFIIQNTFRVASPSNNVATVPIEFQTIDNPNVTPTVVRRDLIIERPPPPPLEEIDRIIWNPSMLPF